MKQIFQVDKIMRKLIAGIEIVGRVLILILFLLQIGMRLDWESSQGSNIEFTSWLLDPILQALILLKKKRGNLEV